MRLNFGDNYLDDENIVLSSVGFCYSITPKPLENYYHKKQEIRYVKIAFQNDETVIPGSNGWQYFELFSSDLCCERYNAVKGEKHPNYKMFIPAGACKLS